MQSAAGSVQAARLIDLTYASADLLERTPLQRPAYLAGVLLVLSCLAGYSLVVLRVKSKKRMLVLLLATGGILCLSSAFYTNQTKVVSLIYELKTSLHAQTSFGYQIDYYGLFATTDGAAKVKVRGQMPIIQELPRSLQQHSFDIDWAEGEGASLVLKRGERRYLRGKSAVLPLLIPYLAEYRGTGIDEETLRRIAYETGGRFLKDEILPDLTPGGGGVHLHRRLPPTPSCCVVSFPRRACDTQAATTS